ncbi:ABC transporter permease [Erysipelothrix urinaevulpis]|uniref:ABC transporter permease n=1 Tax=Erysipelothrix urinaevulpis TaxID=2683717 RepID=UPI0038B34DFE
MKQLIRKESSQNIIASLLAIVVGLLFGLVVLLLTKPSFAFEGFAMILSGGLNQGLRGFGNVLFRAIPILFTGLSVGFAFKTGLFNIGVTGQFTVGAFAAVFVGVNMSHLGAMGWVVGLIAATIAGMLWGGFVGLLKAYRNVNEVISSIMMNYIGMFLVNYLIVNTAYDEAVARTLPPKYAYIPIGGMDKLFPRSSLNIGIIIAVIVAILIYIILNKTTFGYELRAVGLNRHAGKYAGINEKKAIISSMLIAGALAGLGGGLLYLSDVGKYMSTQNVLLGEGFDGISVALLAQSNPIGIIFSSLFISHISYGGNNLQVFGMEPEIIQVITAAIIYMSALSLLLRKLIEWILKKTNKKGEKSI